MLTKITKVYVDAGHPIELPVLFLGDGRPLEPLLKYQLTRRTLSLSWHRRVVLSVSLLMEYGAVNTQFFSSPGDLFEGFIARLTGGTIKDGDDPSGLFWLARKPSDVASMCVCITDFSQYIAANYETPELNPLRSANWSERLCVIAGKMHRRNNSFLSHLTSNSSVVSRSQFVSNSYGRITRNVRVDGGKQISFPDDNFGDLILRGFLVRPYVVAGWMRLNIRDVLITLMLHGGGLRCSEPFHLYINDVMPDPLDETSALIRIGHPSWGSIIWRDPSGEMVATTRGEYLARNGLPQRDKVAGPMHAGWKNPVLDGKYFLQVRWGDPQYGRLFLRLWRIYLSLYLNLKVKPRHPWAWVSFGKGREGEPLKMGRFIAAHDRAVCRIGMQPCRERGTKPHSHRHSYARWLHKLGLPREQIRRYLHHASLASQEVYKQLNDGEMNLAMEVALAQMNEAGKPEVYSEGVAVQGAISPVSGSVAARLFNGIKQVLAED